MDFSKILLFQGIEEASYLSMMDCFGVKVEHFSEGETIFDYGQGDSRVGILQYGTANLVRTDQDGNRTVLERLESGSVFGEMLAFPCLGQDSIWVQCEKECQAAFIPYDQITKRCEKACEHHSKLVENMFSLVREKAMSLSERVEILSRRSIRDKLSAYFFLQYHKEKTRDLRLPFYYSALADYICTDRSAMMRELKKMKEECLIDTQGRSVTLLEDFFLSM